MRAYRRLSLLERQELGLVVAEQYRQGGSIAVLAEQLGTSSGRVRGLLLDQGVRLRAPGGSAGHDRSGRRRLAELLAVEYAAGASLAELAQRYEHPRTTVRALVLTGGARLRPRGPRPAR